MNIPFTCRVHTATGFICLFTFSVFTSCSKSDNFKEQNGIEELSGKQSSMIGTTPSFPGIENLTGQELFSAIYFMDGALADNIPSLSTYKADLNDMAATTPQINTLRHEISIEVCNTIQTQQPTFFSTFKTKISSPNLYTVKEALIEGANLVQNAGLASVKYRNLFKLGATVLNNPTATAEIANIIANDSLLNQTGAVATFNAATPLVNGSIDDPSLPPMLGTSFSINLPKIQLSTTSKIQLDNVVTQYQPQSAELFVCTPMAAVCVYYALAVAHSMAAVSYNAIGAVNLVGYFTVLLKTKAWFLKDASIPQIDLRLEILALDLKRLHDNQTI
ncbi:hypothetical protein [Chitinophaga sp.]|uniref:hypothetical protein n=1 Tax=Chitinophaga sp. TaxID=1869181 RepID=UPI002F927A4B